VMDAPDIDNAVLIRDGGRLRSGEWTEVLVVGVAGCDIVAERVRSARQTDGSKGKRKKL